MYKKEKIFLIFTIFLAALLQSTFLEYLRIAGVKPDILLCLVVFIGLHSERTFSLKIAIFAGFLKDLLSSGIFGWYILTFGLISISLSIYSVNLHHDSKMLQVVVCFVATFLISNFTYFINKLFFPLPNYIYVFKVIILPVTLYTCAVFYLISIFFSNFPKIDRYLS